MTSQRRVAWRRHGFLLGRLERLREELETLSAVLPGHRPKADARELDREAVRVRDRELQARQAAVSDELGDDFVEPTRSRAVPVRRATSRRYWLPLIPP
jgi:hypothetical protein